MTAKAPLKEIVLATRNRKKLKEMERITAGLGIVLRTVDDFPDMPDVVEDGETFSENALKKAREISSFTGLAALSDDSGLEVDALGRAPGVYSARYAGENATDQENVEKMLKDLGGATDRTARFRCVIALVAVGGHGPVEEIFDGTVEGDIGHELRGDNGFGYDPVFFPEGHERTFAEMDASEKDSMSHRGRALKKFREYLDSR